MSAYENSYEEEWYHGIKPFRLFGDEKAFIMGFSLLSEMEFFAVPKNGISLNI